MRFGIHRATVAAVLRRLGVEPRKKGLSDERVAEACRLYFEGWSLARLAERYDVTDMTVRRYLLLAGVVMRSPHERHRKPSSAEECPHLSLIKREIVQD
jgi:hypothetical protein